MSVALNQQTVHELLLNRFNFFQTTHNLLSHNYHDYILHRKAFSTMWIPCDHTIQIEMHSQYLKF